MALRCLNAAENPIQSYNNGFTVLDVVELVEEPIMRVSNQEIDRMVDEVRRKHGDRKIEMISRDLERNPNKNVDIENDVLTPLSNHLAQNVEKYMLDSKEV